MLHTCPACTSAGFGSFEEDGHVFLVMEFAGGRSVAQFIDYWRRRNKVAAGPMLPAGWLLTCWFQQACVRHASAGCQGTEHPLHIFLSHKCRRTSRAAA